jgi:hypothetical protein
MSNYPPGVSGNEPQITGVWPVDWHSPWYAAWDTDGRHFLEDTRREDGYLVPMKDRQAANRVARERNAMIPSQCRFSRGTCTICWEPDLPAWDD